MIFLAIALILFFMSRPVVQGEQGGPSGTGPGYIQGFQGYPTSGIPGV